MDNSLSVPITTRDALLDVLGESLSGGTLEIRSGDVPENADRPETGTLLAVCPLQSPAFTASLYGRILARGPIEDPNVRMSGTATHFRAFRPDRTCALQGTVGKSKGTLILPEIDLVAGGRLTIKSWSIGIPERYYG
jgi:hypothetical protein